MTLKPDNDVICQCGCIVKKYYMPKHLQTAKHEHEMQGRGAKISKWSTIIDINHVINIKMIFKKKSSLSIKKTT